LATTRAGAFLSKWGAPLGITLLAGIMRFVHLGFPHKLVFDETFYVKEGYSYLRHGVELGWPPKVAEEEGSTAEPFNPDESFAAGDYSIQLDSPEFVVHPPLGKWLIAAGMWLFGPDSSFGWRFSAALLGTASVFILILAARRLFRSQLLGCLAGLLMTVDGLHIVLSRTALLDVFLMFFVVLAFYLILVDRAQMDLRLRTRASAVVGHGATGAPIYRDRTWGPRTGMRWYLLAAGVALGMACGVKWSGAYFLAVFGVMVVCWDAVSRRAVGIKHWLLGALGFDAIKAFFTMVPVAVATYVATWAGWFASPKGWGRDWAALNPTEGASFLPPALRALIHYHSEALNFHTGLNTPHSWASSPFGWLFQWHPTLFLFDSEGQCGSQTCNQIVTGLGNPALWWAGIAALAIVLFFAIAWADKRAWAILAGYIAGYVPWLFFSHRTIFIFYMVVLSPFVALAVTYMIGVILGPGDLPAAVKARRARWAGVLVVTIVLVAAFFWPIWSGESIPNWYWKAHIWLPPWG
jgi:dolichyl-phosphate-mannose--protein O-mannosyl transferase